MSKARLTATFLKLGSIAGWHVIHFRVQFKLVLAFRSVLTGLVNNNNNHKKTPKQKRGKKAAYIQRHLFMRPYINGDFRYIHEPLELPSRKLARDTMANLLRRHTFRLPAISAHPKNISIVLVASRLAL
jgi:hypothetical protein